MRLPEFLTELSPVRETLAALEQGENAMAEAVAEKNGQVCVETATGGLALAELTYTYTPELAAGDVFTGTLETKAHSDAAGSYSITQGNLALNENYTIDFHAGTYTVANKLLRATSALKAFRLP